MSTCKTCKHWGLNRGFSTDATRRLKSCSAPSMCSWYTVNLDDIPDNGALVDDDGIQTGPDFGCILHEPLDGAPKA